jgi:ProP effector
MEPKDCNLEMETEEGTDHGDIKINISQQEGAIPPRRDLQEVKNWLELTYPKAFDFSHPIPLKKGIKQEMLANPCSFSKTELSAVLTGYVRSYRYLKSIIRYEWRHDLNGNQVEKILDEEKEYSRKLILDRNTRKNARKAEGLSTGKDLI